MHLSFMLLALFFSPSTLEPKGTRDRVKLESPEFSFPRHLFTDQTKWENEQLGMLDVNCPGSGSNEGPQTHN